MPHHPGGIRGHPWGCLAEKVETGGMPRKVGIADGGICLGLCWYSSISCLVGYRIEVLSCLYRMLGANIAMRVNMDYFGAVEFDLINVRDPVASIQ